MVIISDKLKYVIQNLQDQEKMCIDKYTKNSQEAKDPELQNLFESIKKEEEQHYDSLQQLLSGSVPAVNTKDNAGKDYNPEPTYVGNYNQADKDSDEFLCTDTITTEKYVSSAYNFNLYQFADSDVRRLLNDIETEEQNHAEKIHKYKEVNQMV